MSNFVKLKRIKKIFNSVLFAINIVAIFFLLLSAFSDRVSPNTVMFFAFLGLVFPFILFVNIFFAIWWLIVWKWKLLMINVIAFLICFGSISTYFPLHFKSKKIPEDCIKVLTYNVMKFNQLKKHTSKNPNDLIVYILDVDADIVCLQEYGFTNHEHLITEQEVNDIFGKKYPYRKYVVMVKDSSSDFKVEYGVAIYSKFPINSLKKIPYDSEYNGSCIAELDVKGKKVTLINNHLESNKLSAGDQLEYAGLLRGIKDFDSKKLESITEMVKRKLSVSYSMRAKQADSVAKYINNATTPYVIVCGDFNDTPISYARHKIQGNSLKDSYAETGFGPGITYNKNRFWFRIDYILHSKNIKAYNCTVGSLKDSDHYPVWTYLQLE